METKAQGLGYRIGSGFKRLRSFLKFHESRLVRKAGQSYPKYGVLLARLLFLSIKVGLVILAIAGMAVAMYVAFLGILLMLIVIVAKRRCCCHCNDSDEYNEYWEQKKADDYNYYYLRDDHL